MKTKGKEINSKSVKGVPPATPKNKPKPSK